MPLQSKLDSLTIHGFQSIQRLEEFPLNDLNVLIGPNGAGKSNFVNYFRMLREMVEQRLQVWVRQRGGADRLLTFGVKETDALCAFLRFGRNGYQFTLEPTIDGRVVFTEERMFFDGEHAPVWQLLGNGQTEAELKGSTQPIAKHCYEAISGWKIFHLHDTSDTAGVKRYGSLSDNAYLRTDASNIAAYLYRLQREHEATYDQIRRTAQLAIPFLDDFVLQPERRNGDDEQIRLLWRQKNSDYPMWPSQLSDGSIRFICLTTALLQPTPPPTLIIDEPELGLHPYAITLLGALIRSAATRMQVIISTQSVPLLNEFSIDDLIVVELEDGASVFKRLDEVDFRAWLEDYSIGELWEKNILGGGHR